MIMSFFKISYMLHYAVWGLKVILKIYSYVNTEKKHASGVNMFYTHSSEQGLSYQACIRPHTHPATKLHSMSLKIAHFLQKEHQQIKSVYGF